MSLILIECKIQHEITKQEFTCHKINQANISDVNFNNVYLNKCVHFIVGSVKEDNCNKIINGSDELTLKI